MNGRARAYPASVLGKVGGRIVDELAGHKIRIAYDPEADAFSWEIPEAVRAKIRSAKPDFDRILVAYGDCGTGGLLDQVLQEEGVERIGGPHCYAFYSGTEDFIALAEQDPACFYLTDYLARHFDRLIIEGLGIDRHPELLQDYFGNYTTLVYLAQTKDPALERGAEKAAEKLGLAYEYRYTGYGELGEFLQAAG